MVITIPFSFAQVFEATDSAAFQSERFAGLSSWFTALDGFLSESTQGGKPEAGYDAWVRWSPAAQLPSPSESPEVLDNSLIADPVTSTPTDPVIRTPTDPVASSPTDLIVAASKALDELAMIAFGRTAHEDGLIRLSYLPVFASRVVALPDYQIPKTLDTVAELHGGANPLRVLLAFLSALNVRDREAFRLLAGIELAHSTGLLDFSGLPTLGKDASDQEAFQPLAAHSVSSWPVTEGLLDAEKLLGSWRSSRFRAVKFQPGSLLHTTARTEAGKYLAGLLDTDYGFLVFEPGWAGERFGQDAKQDLNEAWSAIGRAVAIDLRREAAPWLARRLGSATVPSFSLEYTVRPSPSNPYKALMTMRAVVAGVSYGIPYQVAARALGSAASEYFDDAPIPLRYVEEPLPGLRIYVPWTGADTRRAIAELEGDLSVAYPAARRVPSILLYSPIREDTVCADVCIALDGAYREAATGVVLARSFTAFLHGRGYLHLQSLIIHDLPGVDYIEVSDVEDEVDV